MKIELDQYTEMKTIELSQYGGQIFEAMPGWDVLMTYSRTELEQRHGSFGPNGEYCNRHFPIQKHFVLMGRRGNPAETFMAQRDVLQSDLRDLQRTFSDTTREYKTGLSRLESELQGAKRLLENACTERNASVQKEIETVKRMRVLEGDVAKIKKAIGELQFNKIVGAE